MAKVPKVPRNYTSGLSKSTADKRKAEIRKRVKGKGGYKPLPGDAKAKTKPSKYTKKAASIRDQIRLATPKAAGKSTRERFISAAAKVTKIPRGIIQQVYNKGLAAWRVGHRPGATQDQWARARLYSFLTGGKTTDRADAAEYLEAKKALKKKNSPFRLP
jgi:hypothetical protein